MSKKIMRIEEMKIVGDEEEEEENETDSQIDGRHSSQLGFHSLVRQDLSMLLPCRTVLAKFRRLHSTAF
jgi:hypothetical protein